jgi:hypothetical protein
MVPQWTPLTSPPLQYDGAEMQVTKEKVVFKAVFFWYLRNDGYLPKYDTFF